jgi:tRNA(fMet)-specific endonuclease VapC
VPWAGGAADAHGRLRAKLEVAGSRIGDFDEMIAAHALALGAVLVTDNTRRFRRVRNLELENWLR